MANVDYDLNERAVLAMLARINANLNGVIDTINTERAANTTPSVNIEHPRQVLAAPPTAGQLNGGFPIVAVVDGNIDFTDDVGWGATGVYELGVLAYVQDPDPVALAWKLRRYAQALVTVIMSGRNLDAGAWGTKLKHIIPARRLSRVDPNASGTPQLMSWVAVMFEAYDEQNIP